jgi:hypothetical protein
MTISKPTGPQMLAHIASCCQPRIAYCGTSSDIKRTGSEARDLCVVCANFDAFAMCGVCNRLFAGA